MEKPGWAAAVWSAETVTTGPGRGPTGLSRGCQLVAFLAYQEFVTLSHFRVSDLGPFDGNDDSIIGR